MTLPKRLEAPAVMPPRTQLYMLSPCAVGQAEVECFTSYLNRLAWAYHVPVYSLLCLLTDRATIPYFRARVPNALSGFGQTKAMLLNGVEPSGRPWIEGLQTLTGQPNLYALTLGGWARDLNSKRFLRKGIAWCPQCYTEWRASHTTIYQPLLWMIASATICVHHQRYLIDRCVNPTCGRPQRILQIRDASPGCCIWCGTWLGKSARFKCLDKKELRWNQWLHQAIGELAATSQTAQNWDRVVQNIKLIAERLGGISSFAKLVGMDLSAFKSTLGENTGTPSLIHIFHLAYALGPTPIAFMEELFSPEIPVVRHRGWIQLGNRTAKHKGTMKQVKAEVEQFLRDCLEGKQHWVSRNHLARTWDISDSTVSTWYPAEIAELTTRRKVLLAQDLQARQTVVQQEVHVLLQAAAKEGKLLGRKKAAAQVSYPAILLNPYSGIKIWHDLQRQI